MKPYYSAVRYLKILEDALASLLLDQAYCRLVRSKLLDEIWSNLV
jgi:hypothetical protein